MDDLVERAQEMCRHPLTHFHYTDGPKLMLELAAEITRLRSALETARREVPTEEMWGNDLVRALIMWLRQERPIPRHLFTDLSARGIAQAEPYYVALH